MNEKLTITPLGGLGEIGMNCLVFSTAESMIVVDCGLMFPDDSLLGVDVVIPRFDFILANRDKLKAVLLTHGHEDHIGALPWLAPHISAPIYGSRFTLALVENKLREHDLNRFVELRPVEGHDRIDFGDLAATFFPVCHSIIEGFSLGFETPVGRIFHTGDFKLDPTPWNSHATDLDGIADFCGDGLLALLSDSTNIEREGSSLSETDIAAELANIFEESPGRILVTLFSSHIQRIQEIFELAAKGGRRVGVSGRSLLVNIETARDLGFLRIPQGVWRDPEDIQGDDNAVFIVTGSQGEPPSALARIASGEHKHIKVRRGDTVLLSSRFLPGNVKAITKVINRLYKQGAEVLYDKVREIHASGHAYKEELAAMIDATRPKFFIPVHGEYRHLIKHARLAKSRGVASERALVIEDGEPVTFLAGGAVRFEDRVPVESIYVDGKGVGDVGAAVLKERHLLGGEGLVVAALVIDEAGWEILIGPTVQSKGFVFEQQYSHLLENAKCIILDIFENIPPGETEKLKERIRSSLRRFFRKVLERDPVVLPMIMVI